MIEKDILEEDLGDLLREHRGYYLLVNTIARRVRQLQLGERPLSQCADGSRDVVKLTIQELLDSKLKVVPKGHDYKFSEPLPYSGPTPDE